MSAPLQYSPSSQLAPPRHTPSAPHVSLAVQASPWDAYVNMLLGAFGSLQRVAEVLVANGFRVLLTDGATPTPAIRAAKVVVCTPK